MNSASKVFLCAATLLFLSYSPSVAGETVRVAVSLKQHALTLGGPGSLTLWGSDGEHILRSDSSVRILPGNPGMIINGKDSGLRDVWVESQGDQVTVNGSRYTGKMRIKQHQDHLLAVNVLDIEDYLKGVVPVEVSPDWHPEALKVQAISSRTYALYQREARGAEDYDLVSTTQDQVYSGSAYEDSLATRAINETRGMIMTYHGHPILAAYHSTSAGPTEDARAVWGADLPYLRGVNCPFDRASPRYHWFREIPLDRFEESMRAAGYRIGYISTLAPVDQTASGRVGRIRVLHSRGETVLNGAEVRKILGYNEIPSTRFTIEELGKFVKLRGQGWGHGVGLCQWGAKEMAEMGYSHRTILRYFYPGVQIVPYAAVARADHE